MINEKLNEIRRLNQELEVTRINSEKLNNEKMRLLNEIDKVKGHVILLTEQNQKVNSYNFS
jgi:hypothetical protein